MDEKTLKLIKGFAEYIIDNTGLRERDHATAAELHKEVYQCIKFGSDLSSHWKMIAKDLFERKVKRWFDGLYR